MNFYKTNDIYADNLTATTISATTYYNIPTSAVATVYPSGTIQGFIQNHVYPGNTGAGIADRLRAYAITIEQDVVIGEVIMRCTTIQVGSVTFGVYDINISGYPNNLLFEVTTFNTNITGAQSAVVNYSLSAGTYFVASHGTTTNSFVVITRQNMYNTAVGTIDLTNFLANGWSITSTYATNLPNPFPAGGTSTGTAALPALFFQIA